MAIGFHPKAGMILICDFRGYRVPEIVKVRPVVVISPNHLVRSGLVTVVPLSTTAPKPILAYHVSLGENAVPGQRDIEVWAKCDLLATVSFGRLDRIRLPGRKYVVGRVSKQQVKMMRIAAARSLGLDIPAPYT